MTAAETGSSPPRQEPLLTQIKGMGRIFWIANWMELVERFAYYGLRTVVPVYMVLAYEEGGPQFTHVQKGTIFGVWALVQSFLPILTGGFADRFGYKLNIAVATAVKITGYLLMGYAIELGGFFNGHTMAELGGAAGGTFTYPLFFAGAMLLAAGTAIFKPGVQGIIAISIDKKRASVGWALFYQMVNIGGFLGPLVAAYLRLIDWKSVFLICAGTVAFNFVALLTFKEPEHKGEGFGKEGALSVLLASIRGLFEPRLFFFTIIFSGFWLMYNQLFDILPNFIDDWVDSRHAVAAIQHVWPGMPVTPEGNMPQEIMINLNAGLISLFAFLMGYITGRFRTLQNIIAGIGISVASIWMLGMSMSGWWTLLAIGVFSIGEMAASPKLLEYLAGIAPPGKQGLYMGYVNATNGIGWSIGSWVAGGLYDEGGDKVNLARRHLIQILGMDPGSVAALPKTKVLPLLQEKMGMGADQARHFLWDTYHPYSMWTTFALIGLGSMLGLLVFDQITRARDRRRTASGNPG